MEKRTNGVDWDAIYRRIEQSEKELDQIWEPDAERQRQLMEARELRLEQAREALSQKESAPSISVVEFSVAGRSFAVELGWVQRVHAPGEPTPVPETPLFVRGLVNVLGRLILAVDLQKFFGLPGVGLTNLNQMIVIRSSAIEIGLLADEIVCEKTLPIDELQKPLDAGEPWMKYIHRVTPDGVNLTSIETLLADLTPGAWGTGAAKDHP